jgi:hypothetical protein
VGGLFNALFLVGAGVGAWVGDEVGTGVGVRVGDEVGTRVGCAVGGFVVGCGVGTFVVGGEVGARVGDEVGPGVGGFVGLAFNLLPPPFKMTMFSSPDVGNLGAISGSCYLAGGRLVAASNRRMS